MTKLNIVRSEVSASEVSPWHINFSIVLWNKGRYAQMGLKYTYILVILLITRVSSLISSSFSRTPMVSTLLSMFSGIVEEMGTVEDLRKVPDLEMWDGSKSEGVVLTVNANKALEEAYIGCSIAINGVCLTATALEANKFTVGLAPETLRRTNLCLLERGSVVNLERALRADGRNSGHFVQGHVDCTGEIIKKWKEGDSLWVKVKVPSDYIKYIVPKGFICIDGTSLTICETDTKESWFTFMLIAHTQQAVIIPGKKEGDFVNVEVDVLAKMVERSLEAYAIQNEALRQKVESLEARLSTLEK